MILVILAIISAYNPYEIAFFDYQCYEIGCPPYKCVSTLSLFSKYSLSGNGEKDENMCNVGCGVKNFRCSFDEEFKNMCLECINLPYSEETDELYIKSNDDRQNCLIELFNLGKYKKINIFLPKCNRLTFCDQIPDPNFEVGCYVSLAEILNDSTICENLIGSNLATARDVCYSFYGRETKNIEACERISAPGWKEFCYE